MLDQFGPHPAEVELTLDQDRIIIAPYRYATSEEAGASAKRMIAKHRRYDPFRAWRLVTEAKRDEFFLEVVHDPVDWPTRSRRDGCWLFQ